MPTIVIRHNQTDAVLHRVEIPQNELGLGLLGVSLAGIDLAGAAMYALELVGSAKGDIVIANLSSERVDVSGADFTNANLKGAVFSGETIVGVNFANADLSEAIFVRTHFVRCWFEEARFSGARFGDTSFSDCPSLHRAKGLEQIEHFRPTTFDPATLRYCMAELPRAFLLGCGYQKRELLALKALYSHKAEYSSCFLSYARTDQPFADHLRLALLKQGISCWQDTQDIQGGDHWRGQVHDAINKHDKLVLICSRSSLVRPAVVDEILEAITRERQTGKQKLFPLRLDDYVLSDDLTNVAKTKVEHGEWREDWVVYVRSYHIPDFSKWQARKLFRAQFTKLALALRKPGRRQRRA
jgi:uncharacterized protein YjbI with pentapeptide repeats